MKKINRIKANEDFAQTVRKGKTIRNGEYVVHYIVSSNGFARVGISVSTKIGHAIVRNRVKRQIRAMCDSLINYASHTFDIVIVVQKHFLENDFHSNQNSLQALLSKIGK